MGNIPSSHPGMAGTDENRGKEAGGAAASASTASCTSSFGKTVLLHDWWLIKAKEESSRGGLAVGGMMTAGKALRVFNSAPIVKRYDAYTLETADGITVRIQGLINISRMHHNGFPPEACNRFRIGFPYNWKDYADKYFRTDTKGNNLPTCTSDNSDHSTDLANYASHDFPKCLKEFSVGRLIDSLNSICKEIVDGDERSTGTLGNLGANNYNYEKTNGIVMQVDHSVDANTARVAEENVCTAVPENVVLDLNSAMDGSKTSINCMADGSSFCGNIKIGYSLEKNAGFERESLLTAATGQDCEKQRVAPATNGNMCYINTISVSDLGSNSLLSESPPNDDGKSESEAPIKDALTKGTEGIILSSESSFPSSEFDMDASNSAGRRLRVDLVTSASSDVLHTTKQTWNPAKKGGMDSSSFSFSRNHESTNHDQGESSAINHFEGVGFTRILEKNLPNRRQDVHPEVSGAAENSHDAVTDVVLREGCHLNETIVNSVASSMVPSKETPRKDVLIVDNGLHQKTSFNSDVDFRRETICYSKSEPANEQFSLRRSRRLLKLESTVGDNKKSLELKKRIDTNGSMPMVDGIQNGKSSIPTLSKGTSSIEGSGILRKSGDVPAVVARKLNFSSDKSLCDCNTTSIRCMLHIGSDGDKEKDAKSIQESPPKSQASHGHGKEKSRNSRKDNQLVSNTGKNEVLLFSDDHGFLSTKNVIRDSHELSRDRLESDNGSLSLHPMEQSISKIGLDNVGGNVHEGRQSDTPVDVQPSGIKCSRRKAKVSMQKPYSTSEVVTPMTRERARGLSFASPESLNFRRSRSGRLLVPALSSWCQKILYDMDGSVAGILTGMDAIGSPTGGSKSEPSRKRRKQA